MPDCPHNYARGIRLHAYMPLKSPAVHACNVPALTSSPCSSCAAQVQAVHMISSSQARETTNCLKAALNPYPSLRPARQTERGNNHPRPLQQMVIGVKRLSSCLLTISEKQRSHTSKNRRCLRSAGSCCARGGCHAALFVIWWHRVRFDACVVSWVDECATAWLGGCCLRLVQRCWPTLVGWRF